MKDIAASYSEVFPDTQVKLESRGSLNDLYNVMTKTREEQRDNIWAWMGMNYSYYMLNGSTALGKRENDQFPNVHANSVKAYLQKCGSKDGVRKAARAAMGH